MTARAEGASMARAEAAWGADMPDWVRVLAEACDAASQGRVAARLPRPDGGRYSTAVVSYVLARRYAGDLAAVEQGVRAALMADEVACPALGALPLADCLAWQAKARNFAPTSSQRTAMYRACRACPRHIKEGDR